MATHAAVTSRTSRIALGGPVSVPTGEPVVLRLRGRSGTHLITATVTWQTQEDLAVRLDDGRELTIPLSAVIEVQPAAGHPSAVEVAATAPDLSAAADLETSSRVAAYIREQALG